MANNPYSGGFQSGANGGVAAPKQTTHQGQNQADKGHNDGKASTGR